MSDSGNGKRGKRLHRLKMGDAPQDGQTMVNLDTLRESREVQKTDCREVPGNEAATDHINLTAANTGEGTDIMVALGVDLSAERAAEYLRWLIGGKGGKIVGEFPAKMLWMEATGQHIVRIKGNTADIIFERGNWTSMWSRGTRLGMEIGRYTAGKERRFSRSSTREVEEIGANLDCPIRLQMGLVEDYGKVELTLMCLPCLWGQATSKYTGFVGEAPRYGVWMS